MWGFFVDENWDSTGTALGDLGNGTDVQGER